MAKGYKRIQAMQAQHALVETKEVDENPTLITEQKSDAKNNKKTAKTTNDKKSSK
jgi:hypothetical protein